MADLARHEKVSAARVSQLLNLLDLAPEILAAIDVPPGEEPAVTERELRGIAVMLDHGRQMREWRRLSSRDRND